MQLSRRVELCYFGRAAGQTAAPDATARRLAQETAEMREWIAQEENTADPQKLAWIKAAWREKVNSWAAHRACVQTRELYAVQTAPCIVPHVFACPVCSQFAGAPTMAPDDLMRDPELAQGAMHPDVSLLWHLPANQRLHAWQGCSTSEMPGTCRRLAHAASPCRR